MKIRINRLASDAVLPRKGSKDAAGSDLCALLEEPCVIGPGETKLIHTGLAMEIPQGYAGFVYARSGLASKEGLAPANKVGVIDADYRGEVMVSLHNHSSLPRTVMPGQRIAQIVIAVVEDAEFIDSEELTDTDRGEGGFGSTGKN